MWIAGPDEQKVREALKGIPEQLDAADALDDQDLRAAVEGREATLRWVAGDLDRAPVSLSMKPATEEAAHDEYAKAGLAWINGGRAGKRAGGVLDALNWIFGIRDEL